MEMKPHIYHFVLRRCQIVNNLFDEAFSQRDTQCLSQFTRQADRRQQMHTSEGRPIQMNQPLIYSHQKVILG